MGRRARERQFWVATVALPYVPQHIFYDKLNAMFADGGFDDFVEEWCEPFYTDNVGRPGNPPGDYFRILFVGYFEGINSQRGIDLHGSRELWSTDTLPNDYQGTPI
ncbi:hypothetical protein Pan258_46070 [Symmachiella dynata]|nr:hypothetical protein Pan258_46070 [Symmachiella dynata]